MTYIRNLIKNAGRQTEDELTVEIDSIELTPEAPKQITGPDLSALDNTFQKSLDRLTDKADLVTDEIKRLVGVLNDTRQAQHAFRMAIENLHNKTGKAVRVAPPADMVFTGDDIEVAAQPTPTRDDAYGAGA